MRLSQIPNAALLLTSWFALCGTALACLGSNLHHGIVYDDVPASTPADAVVLDVVFDQTAYDRLTWPPIIEAHVRRVVRGHYGNETVRVWLNESSCDSPFVFGIEGLIIGTLHNGPQVDEDSDVARLFGYPIVRGEEGVWFDPISEMVDHRIRRRGIVGDFDSDGRVDRALMRTVGDETALQVEFAGSSRALTLWRGRTDDADRLYAVRGNRYEDECFQMWRCTDNDPQGRPEMIRVYRWGTGEEFVFAWDGDSFEDIASRPLAPVVPPQQDPKH